MTLVAAICVALGAVAGGLTRYAVTRAARERTPRLGDLVGTVVVNTVGALLLGVLAHLAERGRLSATPYALLGTGFCGALTTWSTLARGVAERVLDGVHLQAGLYLLANLALGLAAAYAGWHLAA